MKDQDFEVKANLLTFFLIKVVLLIIYHYIDLILNGVSNYKKEICLRICVIELYIESSGNDALTLFYTDTVYPIGSHSGLWGPPVIYEFLSSFF